MLARTHGEEAGVEEEASKSRRQSYKTEQRRMVVKCLEDNAERYQTVDEVFAALLREGDNIGRTTVYRTLERLAAQGTVSKVVGAPGTSALYRLIAATDEGGQLLCLVCGRVLPLDCSMLSSFANHVRKHHGFAIDRRRTVICGVCEDCQRNEEGSSEGNAHGGHKDSDATGIE